MLRKTTPDKSRPILYVLFATGERDGDTATAVDAAQRKRVSLALLLLTSPVATFCCSRAASPSLGVFPIFVVVQRVFCADDPAPFYLFLSILLLFLGVGRRS